MPTFIYKGQQLLKEYLYYIMLELWKDIFVTNIVKTFDTVLIKITQFRGITS